MVNYLYQMAYLMCPRLPICPLNVSNIWLSTSDFGNTSFQQGIIFGYPVFCPMVHSYFPPFLAHVTKPHLVHKQWSLVCSSIKFNISYHRSSESVNTWPMTIVLGKFRSMIMITIKWLKYRSISIAETGCHKMCMSVMRFELWWWVIEGPSYRLCSLGPR